MKRFTTLALIVFALAAVPAALADDGSTPPATAAPAATQPAGQQDGTSGTARTGARTRVE
ncbi:MAG: hypothetical protein QOF43_1095, partial [Gaiellaceae bacterium]|nr:hypothetical protein [Gaiellaceae bacterium]